MKLRLFIFLWLAVTACRAALPDLGTNVFASPAVPVAKSQLDKLVFVQLAKLQTQPVLCSDAVFVRRAYLDILGTLPTAAEARSFIQDPDTENKRTLLVDSLLGRETFADYWAMRWADILRIKAEFPVNLWPNAAQAYHRWVRASLAENKHYDQFARELLTSSGSNFRVGPVNFYRAIQNRTPTGIAGAVALTFMGARVETWPTNRLTGLAAFFSQIGYKPTSEWKEEHVFWDPLAASHVPGNAAPGFASVDTVAERSGESVAASTAVGTNLPSVEAAFPDGTVVKLSPDTDPREVFANWLIQPKNPWFARCIVNRVWAWLLGRGIIHEADDIRDDNPPSNPALLAYLESQLIENHYNLKWLYRTILTSETYQFASASRPVPPAVEANFAFYPLRRLDAEVLVDALNQITGSSDLYTSPIPEPFTYIPKGMPAVAIADGSITSPFLALFGRSARATGLENERNNHPTVDQCLYLLNSSDVQRKLEQGPRLQALFGFGRKSDPEILDELYLSILSRFPTPQELKVIEAYSSPPPPPRTPPTNSVPTNSPATNGPATNSTSPEVVGAPASAATNAASPTVAVASTLTNTTETAMLAGTSNAPRRGRALGSLGPSRKKGDLKAFSARKREDWVDVAWALITSDEFWYRH